MDINNLTLPQAPFDPIDTTELFKDKKVAVEAGANGTLEYTIKEGVNKNKLADQKILKNKK